MSPGGRSAARRAMEAGLTAAEVLTRQVWFRLPEPWTEGARRWSARRRRRPAPPASLTAEHLAEGLRELLPRPPRLVLVHSSVDRVRLLGRDGRPLAITKAALEIRRVLDELLGAETTLCMPTHPLYKGDPGFLYDKAGLELSYSVSRTPSSVGLLTEFFRRERGTLRSAHPLSALAARGPRAKALLEGNLNEREPLPHGVDSGYFRFCREGGVVLGLGLPPSRYMTVLHVAEEVKDADWPVPGFFRRRRFRVTDEGGGERRVVVRERRPEFVRSLAMQRLCRDVRAEGILREAQIADVPAGVIDARAMLEMMETRQRGGATYPYVQPGLARWPAAPPPPS